MQLSMSIRLIDKPIAQGKRAGQRGERQGEDETRARDAKKFNHGAVQ